MTYQVLERHLKDELQERIPLSASWLVIHSTANPGVGDEAHFKWLDSARQHGWAHYYLDWDSISQVVPEGLVAPAQGSSGNRKCLSIEVCEPPTNVPWAAAVYNFNEAWNRAVWLSADILVRYGWGVDAIKSHADISKLYPAETDHTDPIAFFAKFGKTWADFVAAVADQMRRMVELPPAEKWQHDLMDEFMKLSLVSDRRHPRKPVEWWELAAVINRLGKWDGLAADLNRLLGKR